MNNIKYVTLKPTKLSDLELFFQFQLDVEAIYMAAFTPENPQDKEAYMKKYSRLLQNPTINMKTIFCGNEVAGSISKFEMDGRAEITYWIDKRFWGRGIGTQALHAFLEIEKARPIFGRVAFDNFGSQKVMEKCGFLRIGEDKGFANGRKKEIKEYIYRLTE